jgi:pyruvate-formate lyase-activating enzyme
LLPYHNIAEAKYAGLGREYGLDDVRPPSAEHMKRCAAILGEYGIGIL